MKVKFDVSGMSCAACSARVEKCTREVDGVTNASVNLLTNSMEVEFADKDRSAEVVRAVKKAGYGAKVRGKETVDAEKTAVSDEEKSMRVRLLVSLCLWVPLMVVSMGGMFLEWIGVEIPAFLMKALYAHESAITLAVVEIVLLIPIVFANQKYFRRGFIALFKRSPNMDTLVALGSTAAILYGLFALCQIGYGLGYGDHERVLKYAHDFYFESAGTILTLITLGKYLESRSKGKTSEAITKLMKLAPETVTLLRNGEEIVVKAEEVKIGDIFLVKPGERVAVDGVVVEGNSSFDESAITGESIPVEKKEGDKLVSASVNGAGFVKAEATSVGQDTTLAKIVKLVEEASSAKAPIARLADKISGVFVPIVMGVALVTFIVWMSVGYGLEFALARAIAVLVISCPCALGLATPVAVMVGTGKGAENGILIKSGEALQTLSSVKTVVLDKTGTITRGKPSVTDILGDEETLFVAGSLEKRSEHPLSEAVVAECGKRNVDLSDATDFTAVFGLGVEGKVNGKTCFVGNLAFVREKRAECPAEKEKAAEEYAINGKTPLFVGCEGKIIGVIAVADEVKETSFAAIESLNKQNVRTVMLTGDNERTAAAVGKIVGVDEVVAGVKPDEKEKKISELKVSGKTAMVGDGINDAPALVSADVGIAIGAGSDVALDSADVVLVKSDLMSVPQAVRLSKCVVRNIKENLFWAFFYNAIGIPVAAGVLYPAFGVALSPMIGAAAMSMSSVCVVLNALRLKTVRLTEKRKKEGNR